MTAGIVKVLQWLASGLPPGAPVMLRGSKPEDVCLTVDGEGTIHHPNAIARALARAIDPKLLGATPVAEAEVTQWQTWTASKDVFAEVVSLDQHLQSRSYLVGTAPTLADIQVYWSVAPGVILSFPGPLGGLVNVSRWFDQIQNVVRLFFKEHDATLLPALVSFQPLYKPLSMPVFAKKHGGDAAGAHAKHGAAAKPAEKEQHEGAKPKPPAAQQQQKGGGEAGKEGKGAGKKAAKGGEGAAAPPAPPSGEGKAGGKEGGGKKKEKKAGGGGAEEAKAGAAADDAGGDDGEMSPNALDIRVGVINKAWKHPDSDKLWCEEIDLGEAEPRQIASGLRHFYAEESDLTGRKVLVLANLKARNLGGFKSHGMVLCASNDDHTQVKFVDVPASAKVGDRVIFKGLPGETGEPMSAAQVAKKKAFEKLAPGLVTDDKGVCNYKGVAFTVADEICTAPLPNAHVS